VTLTAHGTQRPAAAPPPAAAAEKATASRRTSGSSPRSVPSGSPGNLRPLFDALRQVESAGNDMAVGDDGRSLGPYQIGLAYWLDGGGDPGRYRLDVWRAAACEAVMLTYWRRYCPAALARGDWETLARVHNGGPRGPLKAATLPYWRKVRMEIEQ